MKVWHDNVVSVFSENIINGCAKMIKPHLTYPIGSSWHIRPPQSASTYLGSLQRSALPLTIAVLFLPFPFQPFASRWVFFVFLFFFFLLLPQSSGCFGGIPVAYSAQWRPVGLSPVHHRVSFVLRNSYSVHLIKWIFFASGVCNNRLLPERVTSPQPNPELGGPLRGKLFFLEQQILSTYSSSKCMKIRPKNFRLLGLKEFVGRGPVISAKEIDWNLKKTASYC